MSQLRSENSSPVANVLVVDDNEPLTELICRFLSNGGVSNFQAFGAEEALAIWQRELSAIGLVVLDVQLPTMSGFALAERFMAEKESLKILLMSGGLMVYPPHPRVTIIQKPFPFLELVELVKRLI